MVSRLSLANHSDSESFLVVRALFSQDGCQREGFWEVVRHVVSPFDLSQTLLIGGGLLVPCSLPGFPVVKQLMQIVTMVPGQGGRLQSVCLPSQARRPEGSTQSRGPAAPAGEVGALGACGFRTASPRGACLWKTGLKEVLERVRRTRAGCTYS